MHTFLIIGLAVLFVLGAPLFSVMLAATAVGALILGRGFGDDFGGSLVQVYGNGATKEESTVFCTIPLFIYAGYIMAAGRTADRLVRFANAAFGWVPGGLAIVTIFACAIFTVFTGASGVTIIALGGVVMPALIKQKYPERFSLGLVAGTGSVGLLFPPALPLFIFGTIYTVHSANVQSQRPEALGQSLKKIYDFNTNQFLGSGVGPGLVLIGCLGLVAVGCALWWKVPRQKFSLRELGVSLGYAIPELMMPVLLIALLLTGVADIPQLAGLAIVYLAIVEMGIFKDFKPITLWKIGTESLALIGTIFLVIYTSQALTNLLMTAEVPLKFVEWTKHHVGAKWVFLLALNVLLLVIGTMMDIFSAMIVVVPLVMGIADYYGVNPYHLGVIFLLNLEIGYIHPPVGINLFITAFKFQRRLGEVVVAVLPFLGAMIVALILVTYVPSITWTPPPKRESPLAALVQIVEDGYQQATAIAEIKLPDGTVLKKADCAEKYKTDENSEEQCEQVFVDVSDCRRAKDKECEDKAVAAYLESTNAGAAGASVDSITFPNGTTIKQSDCASLSDSLDQDACVGLFGDIAECRRDNLGKDCEDDKIKDYLGDYPIPKPAGGGGGSGSGTASGSGSGTGSGTGTGTGSASGTGSGSAPAPTAVDQVKLPSGKILKKADCATIASPSDKGDCQDLFEETLPNCGTNQGCIDGALKDYVENMGPDGLGTP